MPSSGALSPRVSAVAASIVFGCLPGCRADDQACQDDVRTIQSCNRVFRNDPCESPGGACNVDCFSRLPCDQYAAIDQGAPYPASLSRCLEKCEEFFRCSDGREIDSLWRCDGVADCADGSDEGGACQYYSCRDGQRVRATARCDDYVHCVDGSDEEGCQ
ncbi:MAG: low-density lipoprotein receptor class A repeat-containing protein [Myxococcales bacterium]